MTGWGCECGVTRLECEGRVTGWEHDSRVTGWECEGGVIVFILECRENWECGGMYVTG